MFNELVIEIVKTIQSFEKRQRLRTSEEQNRFEYAVRYILLDLWKGYPLGVLIRWMSKI